MSPPPLAPPRRSPFRIGAGCNLPLLAVIGVPVALVLGAAVVIAVWWSRRVRKAAASRDHYSEVETLLGSRAVKIGEKARRGEEGGQGRRNGTVISCSIASLCKRTRSLPQPAAIALGIHPLAGTRDDGGVGPEDFHELSVLSTASLDDFRVVRSIAAGANGQIFEAKCLIGQVRRVVTVLANCPPLIYCTTMSVCNFIALLPPFFRFVLVWPGAWGPQLRAQDHFQLWRALGPDAKPIRQRVPGMQ